MTDKGLLLRGFSRMHDENDIVFEKVVLLHPGTSKETLIQSGIFQGFGDMFQKKG